MNGVVPFPAPVRVGQELARKKEGIAEGESSIWVFAEAQVEVQFGTDVLARAHSARPILAAAPPSGRQIRKIPGGILGMEVKLVKLKQGLDLGMEDSQGRCNSLYDH